MPEHAARTLAALCPGILLELDDAVCSGVPADQAFARMARSHREWGGRDRRVLSGLAFSRFRWRGWLPPGPERLAEACVCSGLLDGAEASPAVRRLAAQAGITEDRLRPFGQMPLKEKAERLAAWRGESGVPAPDALAPAWVRAALGLAGAAGDGLWLRCLEAFQARPPTWLRAVRGAEADVAGALPAAGSKPEAHPLVAGALRLPPGSAPDLESGPLRGRVFIQDLASQCAGLACAPHAGERWWDACAGAGGKTLHLLDLMGASGNILATDARGGALEKLRRRLPGFARDRVRMRTWNGPSEPPPDTGFDGVLVDAPCSGLGTWGRNPDARWRASAGDPERMAGLQRDLLASCGSAVRKGGALVYVTCTLTRAENEDVAEWFPRACPEFEIEPAINPVSGRPASGAFRIWPWEGDCNGLFIARFRRRG